MVNIIIILVVVAICSTARADIIRPCLGPDNRHNIKCVRDNLAANSDCRPTVKGSLPNEYSVKKFRFEAPYFNSTYIDKDLVVKNHDKCFVSEFFLNTKTNTAVLTIDCPNLDLESDRVLIQHRSKREDTYYSYHIHATYPLIRITVNLHSYNHLDLCKSHVYTEVTALPHFHIKPHDKRTDSFLSRDLTELMVFERECFFYRGGLLSKIFVDSLICDYGCHRHILPHYNEDSNVVLTNTQ